VTDARDVLAPVAAAVADLYTILREIGAGGMTTVYLADDSPAPSATDTIDAYGAWLTGCALLDKRGPHTVQGLVLMQEALAPSDAWIGRGHRRSCALGHRVAGPGRGAGFHKLRRPAAWCGWWSTSPTRGTSRHGTTRLVAVITLASVLDQILAPAAPAA